MIRVNSVFSYSYIDSLFHSKKTTFWEDILENGCNFLRFPVFSYPITVKKEAIAPVHISENPLIFSISFFFFTNVLFSLA